MMLGESKSGMQCTEFDALLTEAVDGTLSGERRLRFEQHQASCPACSTLFAEVTTGLDWLGEIEDVAPPAMLVHNILAATSAAAQPAPAVRRFSAWDGLRRKLHAAFAPVLTPRFGMSMGMAFFSIMLVLNMAQIRITDLTPHNLSHSFYSSQNKVMKYYENMRLVVEIESRVRDLRNTGDDNGRDRNLRENKSRREQQQNQKSEPEGPHRREYSRGEEQRWLAALRLDEMNMGITYADLATQRREL